MKKAVLLLLPLILGVSAAPAVDVITGDLFRWSTIRGGIQITEDGAIRSADRDVLLVGEGATFPVSDTITVSFNLTLSTFETVLDRVPTVHAGVLFKDTQSENYVGVRLINSEGEARIQFFTMRERAISQLKMTKPFTVDAQIESQWAVRVIPLADGGRHRIEVELHTAAGDTILDVVTTNRMASWPEYQLCLWVRGWAPPETAEFADLQIEAQPLN